MKIDYSFYLILDEESCGERSAEEMLAEIIDGGITCVQLRIKNKLNRHIKKIGEMILAITRSRNIPLIINDYIELAKEIDADGVHIGMKDASYETARNALGYDKIIGLSLENIAQAEQFGDLDVDYFGVGPIFPTATKLDAALPIGIIDLKKIIKYVKKPVVAIGGIHLDNLEEVLATGVSGIAVISAVLKAKEPLIATKNIAAKISALLTKREKYGDR